MYVVVQFYPWNNLIFSFALEHGNIMNIIERKILDCTNGKI